MPRALQIIPVYTKVCVLEAAVGPEESSRALRSKAEFEFSLCFSALSFLQDPGPGPHNLAASVSWAIP